MLRTCYFRRRSYLLTKVEVAALKSHFPSARQKRREKARGPRRSSDGRGRTSRQRAARPMAKLHKEMLENAGNILCFRRHRPRRPSAFRHRGGRWRKLYSRLNTPMSTSYTESVQAASTSSKPTTSTPSTAPASAAEDDAGKKKKTAKRRKVNHACLYCRRSHMTCDEGRPCQRW